MSLFDDLVKIGNNNPELRRSISSILHHIKQSSPPLVGCDYMDRPNKDHKMEEFMVLNQPEGWDNRDRAVIEYGVTLNYKGNSPTSYSTKAKLKIPHRLIRGSHMEPSRVTVKRIKESSVVVEFESEDTGDMKVEYGIDDKGVLRRVR